MRTVILFRTLFVILLTALFTTSFSQTIHFQSAKERNENKPQLFAKDSTKSLFNKEYIEDILSMSVDDKVEIELTKHTTFKGKITLINNPHSTATTMMLKSDDVDSLMFIISKITVPPDDTIYRALLMSNNYKDMLMLEKDNHDGKYYWSKRETADLIPD